MLDGGVEVVRGFFINISLRNFAGTSLGQRGAVMAPLLRIPERARKSAPGSRSLGVPDFRQGSCWL
jgi:hypothetical protein